jgi:pimeloyl-ACP methyl ester carboxylesterase
VAGARCPDLARTGRQITFGDGLRGVVLGDGASGVVLAHMSGGSVCQWLPYGAELAGRGYRVLAFDFAGSGASPRSRVTQDRQVVAAAAALRADGARSVALVGGSMGARRRFLAAPTAEHGVDRVTPGRGPDSTRSEVTAFLTTNAPPA